LLNVICCSRLEEAKRKRNEKAIVQLNSCLLCDPTVVLENFQFVPLAMVFPSRFPMVLTQMRESVSLSAMA